MRVKNTLSKLRVILQIFNSAIVITKVNRTIGISESNDNHIIGAELSYAPAIKLRLNLVSPFIKLIRYTRENTCLRVRAAYVLRQVEFKSLSCEEFLKIRPCNRADRHIKIIQIGVSLPEQIILLQIKKTRIVFRHNLKYLELLFLCIRTKLCCGRTCPGISDIHIIVSVYLYLPLYNTHNT